MGLWVVSFVGGAVLYGGLASLILLGLWHVLRPSPGATAAQPTVWRFLPLAWVTLTFVALTIHPFPDPATLACPVPQATPQLIPFKFYQAVRILRWQDAGLWGWLTNLTLVATLMNFVLCVMIGWAFARHQAGFWPAVRWAALFGAVLTLTVELTQLTGIWGYFPCAYRQFNVDDLMFNFFGVLSGTALKKLFFKA